MGRVARVLVLVMVVGMIPVAAGAAPGPRYFVDESTLPFGPVPGHEDSTRLWGVHNKAGYRIEVPADWNGDLVMWAHGFRGFDERLFFLPDEFDPGLRAYWLDQGFAWAASTYSKNDYNVAQGVKDTHALSRFFNGKVGKPDRVFIAGASMGGHITAVSIEQYRNAYVGAMPVCGVLGDYEHFDFYLDFNLAAQQLALGTSSFPIPESYPVTTAPQIKSSLEAFDGGWPNALNADGQAFKQLVELRSGGDRPNFDQAWFFWNTFPEFATGPGNFLFDLGVATNALPSKPGTFVENTDVVYQVDLDPTVSAFEQALNDSIARVAADPSARSPNGLANVPAVLGDPPVPVLTLHNLGDLFVPFHNEIVYAGEVAANGASDNLVQRAIRGVNHCGFTTEELVRGFSDLVAWVDGGPKPDGDDVLDPAVVAAADYGCRFTEPISGHLLPQPCP